MNPGRSVHQSASIDVHKKSTGRRWIQFEVPLRIRHRSQRFLHAINRDRDSRQRFVPVGACGIRQQFARVNGAGHRRSGQGSEIERFKAEGGHAARLSIPIGIQQ